jgi:hypothetical protein
MQLLGYIEAVSETAAIDRAAVLFSLDDKRRKRGGQSEGGEGEDLTCRMISPSGSGSAQPGL